MLASNQENPQRIRLARLLVPLSGQNEQLPRLCGFDNSSLRALRPLTRQEQPGQTRSSGPLDHLLRGGHLVPEQDQTPAATRTLVSPLAQIPHPGDGGAGSFASLNRQNMLAGNDDGFPRSEWMNSLSGG